MESEACRRGVGGLGNGEGRFNLQKNEIGKAAGLWVTGPLFPALCSNILFFIMEKNDKKLKNLKWQFACRASAWQFTHVSRQFMTATMMMMISWQSKTEIEVKRSLIFPFSSTQLLIRQIRGPWKAEIGERPWPCFIEMSFKK